ncbi:T9SS type A sorting domain-containing protein [Crocinitomix catalasitica]|nr:T9SS type A sorting domain-containing protein [Crocinitomix catalasitica]
MKKIYTLITALSFAAVSTAQIDMAVTLDVAGASSSADPLDMTFTVTNNGGTIPEGDSIAFALFDGTTYYAMDLTAGFYNFVELDAASGPFLNGETKTYAPSPITMDWIYTNIGLTANMCAIAWVQNGTAVGIIANIALDVTPTDNTECCFYTVTSVVGIELLAVDLGSVYAFDNVLRIENNLNSDVENVSVVICSLTGQIVQNETITLNGGLNEIGLNNTTRGIYLVTISANGTSTTKKVSIR